MGFNPLLAAKKKAEQSGTDMKTELKAQAPRPTQRASNIPSGRGNTSAGNRGSVSGSGRRLRNNANGLNLRKLTAPYNFVSLNKVVLKAPIADKVNDEVTAVKAYKEYLTSDAAKYSGYFTVEVKNLTPLFIDNGKHTFFSDGKNLCIPGSSLRGAIQNYFKIITNGTMRTGDDPDVTDSLLYYRTFAAGVDYMRNEYNAEMKPMINGHDELQSHAGFLVREGKEYFICPAHSNTMRYPDSQLQKAYKRNGQPLTNQRGEQVVRATINRRIDWSANQVVVYTDKMDDKKHYYVISGPSWNVKMPIPEKVMAGYRDDKNAKGIRLLNNKEMSKAGTDSLNILHGAESYDYIMPCFYVADGNEIKSFGSGPLYRIPYKKSIGEHIPANVNSDKLDFTAMLFGNKDSWSSRVFFENLYLQKDAGKENEAVMIPLMGANPTSFQNYLEAIDSLNANHWNSDANIRGYKMYWHRKCDWRRPADASNTNENVTKKVAPLKPGCSFTGRIRFENLSAAELGALVKVLSLGDNGKSAYKLGMGKPIGMGSVELKSKLYLQQDNYYTKLFGDNGFDAGLQEQDKKQYIASFEGYMESALNADSLNKYNARMKELALIMDKAYLDQRDWPDKTAYMDINDRDAKKVSNNRIPLPSIAEVVKKP